MMKTKGFFIQVVIFVLMVVLICACGPAQASPTPIPPTATAEPTPIPVKPTVTTASPPVFDITFDGNECKIVGPDTIPQGKVTLIMHNPGDEEYRVFILGLVKAILGTTLWSIMDRPDLNVVAPHFGQGWPEKV